jgi:hypothetical protein
LVVVLVPEALSCLCSGLRGRSRARYQEQVQRPKGE